MLDVLIKIRTLVFICLAVRTVQSSSDMFACFSDVCSRQGYFECSETERRCKECAVFYTDTCGTGHQPAGCYAYCTESLNKSLQEQLQTEETKLAHLDADYQRVNDTNAHLHDAVLQLNAIVHKLNSTNQDLQNNVAALNFTNEEIRATLTASEEKNLNLRQTLEEKSSANTKLTLSLSLGLGITLLVLVVVLIVFTFFLKKRRCRQRKKEEPPEHKMSELMNIENNVGDLDENANAHKKNEKPVNATIYTAKEMNEMKEQPIDNKATVDETEHETKETGDKTREDAQDANDSNTAQKPTQETGMSSPSECVASGNA